MHDPLTQICSFPTYAFQEWMRTQWWIPKKITYDRSGAGTETEPVREGFAVIRI